MAFLFHWMHSYSILKWDKITTWHSKARKGCFPLELRRLRAPEASSAHQLREALSSGLCGSEDGPVGDQDPRPTAQRTWTPRAGS